MQIILLIEFKGNLNINNNNPRRTHLWHAFVWTFDPHSLFINMAVGLLLSSSACIKVHKVFLINVDNPVSVLESMYASSVMMYPHFLGILKGKNI